MLYSIHKLSVINLLIEIIDNALVLSILGCVFSKIDTVFIFFQDRLCEINRESFSHFLKVSIVLIEAHVVIKFL